MKKEAEWAAGYSTDAMQTWYYGYVIMLLSEYKMATGDDSFMPGLQRLAMEAANGQSIVGSWGHGFAGPDGRLGRLRDDERAGRAADHLAGHGPQPRESRTRKWTWPSSAAPGCCASTSARAPSPTATTPRGCKPTRTTASAAWPPCCSTCSMSPKGPEFFSRMSVASHGPERDYGHTGNFSNILWSMPGVALSGPQATGAWMQEFGAWYFDLARRWDGSFLHQGPPEMPGTTRLGGWDCHRRLPAGLRDAAQEDPAHRQADRATSRKSMPPPRTSSSSTAAAGRNKDRNSVYDKLTGDQLFDRLGQLVADRARARRDGARPPQRDRRSPPSSSCSIPRALESRLGACQALALLKGRPPPPCRPCGTPFATTTSGCASRPPTRWPPSASPRWPPCRNCSKCSPRARPRSDPRGMEQRYLCFALFAGGLLGNSLEGVDRELLHKAVAPACRTRTAAPAAASARSTDNLSYDEIKPLLPAIHRAVVEPAPSGIMFADGIRLKGLHILAKHRVREGIDACVEYTRTQNPWASENRTPELMKILLEYGAAAKPAIPELKKIADSLENDPRNHMRQAFPKQAEAIRNAIRETIPALEAL